MVIALLTASSLELHAGVVADIPVGRQVVLKPTQSSWMPSTVQTKEGLLAIQAYLEKSADAKNVDPALTAGSEGRRLWIASEVRKILANKDGYRVQFWGTTEEKTPVIYCNFFPAPTDEPEGFPYWRRQPVQVDDGGFVFWFATYDPKAKAVVMFQSNGYARRALRQAFFVSGVP